MQTSATTYNYDATGNRTQMVANGVTTTYTYNALDQLTNETTGTTSIDYTYDASGNLSTTTEKDNGVTVATTSYTWDAMGRLQTATTPGASIVYAYDHDGRRTEQAINGTDVAHYLWDEFSTYGDVLLEYDDANTLLTRYTLGGDGLIAQTSGGTASYYLPDAQHSTRLLTDTTGNVTDTYRYSAYGELLDQTSTTSNAYLYTGQRHVSFPY